MCSNQMSLGIYALKCSCASKEKVLCNPWYLHRYISRPCRNRTIAKTKIRRVASAVGREAVGPGRAGAPKSEIGKVEMRKNR
jgi:hypothetical protein